MLPTFFWFRFCHLSVQNCGCWLWGFEPALTIGGTQIISDLQAKPVWDDFPGKPPFGRRLNLNPKPQNPKSNLPSWELQVEG